VLSLPSPSSFILNPPLSTLHKYQIDRKQLSFFYSQIRIPQTNNLPLILMTSAGDVREMAERKEASAGLASINVFILKDDLAKL